MLNCKECKKEGLTGGFKALRIDCVFCSVIYNMGGMFICNLIHCETQGSGCSQSQSPFITTLVYVTPSIWRQIFCGTNWFLTVSTLAINLILLSRFAGTKPMSHVFASDLLRLCKSPAGATTSDVIFPFVHTDPGVTCTDRWNYTAVLDAPLNTAWRGTTGGSHGSMSHWFMSW